MSVAETSINLIDKDAIRTHHRLVWGNHEWPENTSIAVCHRDAGREGISPERVPVQDVDAFVDLVARRAKSGEVWVNVAPQPSTTTKRGGRKDSLSLSALFADIDIDTGAHKAGKAGDLPLPSDAEALAIIARCPLQLTMVVHTGGGYHIWVSLDTPLDHRTPDGQDVLNRWKAWWVGEFATAGRHLDEGVLADVARMLRVAGTANHKMLDDIRPVYIVGEPGGRVALADVLQLLPPIPIKASRTPLKKLSAAMPVNGEDGNRPGDLLQHAVPVGALLERVLGWVNVREVDGGARWRAPDSESNDDHAQSYPGDDGIETVTVFGERLAASLGMDGVHRTWNSWDLLIWRCGGDTHLAARVARRCGDTASLCAALTTHGTIEALAKAFPESVEMEEISVPDAIVAWDGSPIRTGKLTYAVVGGLAHGVHFASRYKDFDGTWKDTTEQITDWVAWRSDVITRLRINDRCLSEVVGESEYTVEVITLANRHYTHSGLTAKESVSAQFVIDAVNAGVELPIERQHVLMADNMLRMLGHKDQRKNAIYTSMGWCYVDGKTPAYLCPNGSITPMGVTNEYTVGAYGGDAAGLGTAMRRTGFAGADMPVHEAAEAIQLFCKIAPSHPEIAIALIGLVMSSALKLSTRGVGVITGQTDAGKTLLSSACAAFFSDVKVGGKDVSSLYIPSSSEVGAAGVMAWCRDGLAVCDDYRRTDNDKAANATMTKVMAAITQAAYGSPPAAKATQSGGMRESRDQAASALITAEVSADQAAIRNRGVTVLLARADGVTAIGGPFDAFKASANTGTARSLMAHYITYLARHAAAKENGLEWMSDVMNTRANRNYMKLAAGSGGRAAETVAALMTGWQTFRAFAREAGIESFLPSEATVDAALRSLAASNAASATESDPGRRVLDEMADMLAGNSGHLVSATGDQPIMDRHSLGWVTSVTQNEHGTSTRPDPKGPMLGTLSADQSAVVVGRAGIKAAMVGAQLDGLAPQQVYDAVARLTVPGSGPPGARCPAKYVEGRPDGFVVPADLLGLGFVVDAPVQVSDLDDDEPVYEDF